MPPAKAVHNEDFSLLTWRRNIPTKKDSVVNRALIHNQSSAAIVCSSLPYAMHIREKQKTKPSFLCCVPAGLVKPYKGVPGMVFQPMG